MATFEVQAGDKTFEIEAPDIKKAESVARLYAARLRMTEAATAGAARRSEGPAWYRPESSGNVFTDAAVAAMGGEGGAYADPNATAGDIASRAATLGAILSAGAGAAGGVVPLAKGAGLSLLGTAAGGLAGRGIGTGLEAAGAPAGTSRVLGTAGGVAGSLVGPFAPGLVMKGAQVTGGGKVGALLQFLGRLTPAAEQAAARVGTAGMTEAQAARHIEIKLAQLAEKRAAREATASLAERRIAVGEERNRLLKMRLEGKALPAPPPTATAPAPGPAAPAAAASTPVLAPPSSEEVSAIVLKIQQLADTPASRKVVREWLAAQPKEVASQVRLMLARRQGRMATIYTKPSGEDPSAELARMLGQ